MFKLKYIIYICSISFSLTGFSQTNIDTSFLYNVWSPSNMIVTELRDGIPVKFCQNKNEWVEAAANNQPAYCYYGYNSSKGVLYNGHAANNKYFAPYGWSMPSEKDFLELCKAEKELRGKSGGWGHTPSTLSQFSAHADGYLEGEGCETIKSTACGSNSVCNFYYEGKRAIYWTKNIATEKKFHGVVFNITDDTKYDTPVYIVDNILFVGDSKLLGFYEENTISGASIRFVRNKDEYTPVLPKDYKTLMPGNYIELRDEMYQRIANNIKPEGDLSIFSLYLNLRFDQNGINRSEVKDVAKYSYDDIAFDYLRKWKQSPIYRGKKLMSSQQFDLKIEVVSFPYDNYRSFYNNSLYYDEKFTESLGNEHLSFSSENRRVNFYSNTTGELEKTISGRYFTGAKGRGPVNIPFCILPGLGSKRVVNMKKTGWNAVVLSSSILGLTSVVSKLISNQKYGVYKEQNVKSTRLYKEANDFQKVFLISGGAYGLLMLIDLSATITIGMKNKKDQRIINKYIKLEAPNGISF